MDNLIVLSYNWNYLERFLGVPYPGAGHIRFVGASLEGSLLGNRL